MKKQLIFTFISVLVAGYTLAQTPKQYKIRFSGADKRVHILVQQNSIIVEGYDGDEVIIEQVGERKDLPREAEGLRMITGGVLDNTGLGANVDQEGNALKISIPRSKYNGNFSVKIPKNLALTMQEDNSYGDGRKWTISKLAGEIELKTGYTTVYANDITGPLVANTGYGKIYVTYSSFNAKAPHSISSTGAIDVTLPTDAKVNLKMRSYYGDIFTDWDVTPTKKTTENVNKEQYRELANADAVRTVNRASAPTPTPGQSVAGVSVVSGTLSSTFPADCDQCPNSWGKDSFDGTINGGGGSLQLKSSNGNIYLRKKK